MIGSLSIFAGNQDRHKISNEFKFRTVQSYLPLGASKNAVSTIDPSFFDWIFVELAGSNDGDDNSDEFNIRRDRTNGF